MRAAILLLIFALKGSAGEILVEDLTELPKAIQSARAGDTIVLPSGIWRDVNVRLTGTGTEHAPITLRAREPGKTVLTGSSTLRIGGEFLVVEGIHFLNPDPGISNLIEFRLDSKKLASHCRLTNCRIENAADQASSSSSSSESRWVGIYGDQNRVDHCDLYGKSNKGTTLVVWLGDRNQGNHRIDHNYFGPRQRLGQNGGETIRVGDSKTSMLRGQCVIERNLFDRCNGEAECISNKSCGNLYRENTFWQVSGTLTLRHGNGCVVEKNGFFGAGNNGKIADGTGGVRIIGEDHVVRGNYFENLSGDDARSAISLMMGIPNSPLHRYFQVKRAIIEDNRLVNCEHPILIGLNDDKNGTLAPIETVFRRNHIRSPKARVVEARCELDGVTWEANEFMGRSLGIDTVPGIALTNPQIEAIDPITRDAVGTRW